MHLTTTSQTMFLFHYLFWCKFKDGNHTDTSSWLISPPFCHILHCCFLKLLTWPIFFILMVMMRWVKLVRYFGVTSFPHILLTPKRLSKTIWTGITGIDRSEPHACSKSATLFESVVEKLPWFWLFIHTYTAISETGLVYGIALFCINSMYKFHIIYCYLSSYLRGISVFGCYSSYLEGVIFVTSFFIKVLGVHLLVLLKSC